MGGVNFEYSHAEIPSGSPGLTYQLFGLGKRWNSRLPACSLQTVVLTSPYEPVSFLHFPVIVNVSAELKTQAPLPLRAWV
jgi:hypothetical protein